MIISYLYHFPKFHSNQTDSQYTTAEQINNKKQTANKKNQRALDHLNHESQTHDTLIFLIRTTEKY